MRKSKSRGWATLLPLGSPKDFVVVPSSTGRDAENRAIIRIQVQLDFTSLAAAYTGAGAKIFIPHPFELHKTKAKFQNM